MINTTIKRVVDLIVELESGDPTQPVEVWSSPAPDHPFSRLLITRVEQMTPTMLAALGEADERTEPQPLPLVIFAEPKR